MYFSTFHFDLVVRLSKTILIPYSLVRYIPRECRFNESSLNAKHLNQSTTRALRPRTQGARIPLTFALC